MDIAEMFVVWLGLVSYTLMLGMLAETKLL